MYTKSPGVAAWRAIQLLDLAPSLHNKSRELFPFALSGQSPQVARRFKMSQKSPTPAQPRRVRLPRGEPFDFLALALSLCFLLIYNRMREFFPFRLSSQSPQNGQPFQHVSSIAYIGTAQPGCAGTWVASSSPLKTWRACVLSSYIQQNDQAQPKQTTRERFECFAFVAPFLFWQQER